MLYGLMTIDYPARPYAVRLTAKPGVRHRTQVVGASAMTKQPCGQQVTRSTFARLPTPGYGGLACETKPTGLSQSVCSVPAMAYDVAHASLRTRWILPNKANRRMVCRAKQSQLRLPGRIAPNKANRLSLQIPRPSRLAAMWCGAIPSRSAFTERLRNNCQRVLVIRHLGLEASCGRDGDFSAPALKEAARGRILWPT